MTQWKSVRSTALKVNWEHAYIEKVAGSQLLVIAAKVVRKDQH